MNRRTLKKKCRRAMEALIARHGYARDSFVASDGGESIYAPPGMERRFDRNGFLDPGPLKGTMLLWQKTSYEYDEWDAALPSEVLREVEFWEVYQPTDEDLRAWDAAADAKNAELQAGGAIA